MTIGDVFVLALPYLHLFVGAYAGLECCVWDKEHRTSLPALASRYMPVSCCERVAMHSCYLLVTLLGASEVLLSGHAKITFRFHHMDALFSIS